MIRVCKDGKRKYKSLGLSVHPDYWDFKKNKPKTNCPKREIIQKIINEKVIEYSDHILDLNASGKDYTASSLILKQGGNLTKTTVGSYLESQMIQLKSENRLNYCLTFKQLRSSMTRFNKTLDIYFSDIDKVWLKKYELWLKSEGLKLNSIGVLFRTLRVLYNRAIEENIVKQEQYPFKSYKVSKLKQETIKRAITKDEVKKIINTNISTKNEYFQLAIDVFYFSYLCAGINFKDIAYLTKSNIIEKQLAYYRKKTKKLIKIPIQDEAMKIIQKYVKNDEDYLFPILDKFHQTEQQKANRIHKTISKININLKMIGEKLMLPIDLTTYVARHSFATVLKRSGVSTSIISESLGHSSEKITQIYLDSFENSQIDEAMKNLLWCLKKTYLAQFLYTLICT